MELEEAIKHQTEMIRSIFGEGDAKRDALLVVPEGIEAFYDILYDENNQLDIYYPMGTKTRLPVIVNVHGGAYVYGTKDTYKYYGMFMAQQGFVFVNASYRLAPETKFPSQLEEICHVFQWMIKNDTQYYIDINNVF